MALLTLGKNIMTIENAKGPILVNMLFWVGSKKLLSKNLFSSPPANAQRNSTQNHVLCQISENDLKLK